MATRSLTVLPDLPPADAAAFARLADEHARWWALPEDKRAAPPAWWWSSALALRHSDAALPDDWHVKGQRQVGAFAQSLLAALAAETRQPWPDEFPQRYTISEPHVVEDTLPTAQTRDGVVA